MIYEYFFPDYSHKAVDDIDVQELYESGIRYALLDIDNTIVPYTSPFPDDKALKFLKSLSDNGIRYCFVSNNNKNRVEEFNKYIGVPVYPRAKKPLLFGIDKAMRDFGAVKENTVLIGDQIFTDIYGGNRMKFYSVLVTAVGKNETNLVAIKRYFEKLVLREYRRSLKKQSKQGK